MKVTIAYPWGREETTTRSVPSLEGKLLGGSSGMNYVRLVVLA